MAWVQLATKNDMGEAEVLLGRGGRYYYDGVKNGQKTFHYVAQKVAKYVPK